MNRWTTTFLPLCSLAMALAQPKNRWKGWKPFLGRWQGSGTAEPGSGSSSVTRAHRCVA